MLMFCARFTLIICMGSSWILTTAGFIKLLHSACVLYGFFVWAPQRIEQLQGLSNDLAFMSYAYIPNIIITNPSAVRMHDFTQDCRRIPRLFCKCLACVKCIMCVFFACCVHYVYYNIFFTYIYIYICVCVCMYVCMYVYYVCISRLSCMHYFYFLYCCKQLACIMCILLVCCMRSACSSLSLSLSLYIYIYIYIYSACISLVL